MNTAVIHVEVIEPTGPGRPSDYSEALTDTICERIGNGESLRRVCAAKDMPDRTTVLRWLHSHPEFAAKYARAREDQAENEHDKMAEIEMGVLQRQIDPKAANVVLGNMRWRMEKLKPKVFGAAVKVEHSGKIGLEQLVAGTDASSE